MANVEELTEGLDPEAQRIGKILRNLRNSYGWTLQALGEEVGRSHHYLSKIERGHRTAPPTLIQKISSAYDIPHEVVISLIYPAQERTG